MNIRSAQLALGFACVGHAFVHFFAAFYFVIALALEQAWGRPYHELIELWTLGALLIGVAALPAGWLGDRLGPNPMMIAYFLGLGGAAFLCGFASTASELYLGLAGIGLFAAIYHPVGIAWVVKSAEQRGKALGINGIFGGMGVAATGLISGALIDVAGWRAAFMVPGVACVLVGLALWFCVRTGRIADGHGDRRPEAPPQRGDMLRTYAILLVTMVCMGLIYQSTQAALPKLFDLRLGMWLGDGTLGVGLVVSAVYTFSALVQYVGGHLADRHQLKAIYTGGFVLQSMMLALVAGATGVPLVVAAAMAVMLNSSVLPAENMLLARYTPEQHRSLAFGAKFVLSFGIAPLALMLVSFVQARSGEFFWLFVVLAGVAVLALLVALMLPSGRDPEVAPAVE